MREAGAVALDAGEQDVIGVVHVVPGTVGFEHLEAFTHGVTELELDLGGGGVGDAGLHGQRTGTRL